MSNLKVGSVKVSQEDRERARELLQKNTGEIIWLAAGDLLLDPAYQRDPTEAKAAEIGREWDWLAAGILFVSRRSDGRLFLIDGGHRSQGAVKRFGAGCLLECKVYEGLTVAQEAGMFYLMNAKRGLPSILKRYKAALLSGNAEVVEITEVVQSAGLTPSFTGVGTDDGAIVCWGALHQLYRQGGRGHLDEILSIIQEIWSGQRIALEGQFIKAVSLLVRHHGKEEAWSRKEAVERLKRISALEIEREAQAERRTRAGKALPPQYAIYHSLVWFYNRQRRTSKLTDPKKPK